jgi:hypothetical protein
VIKGFAAGLAAESGNGTLTLTVRDTTFVDNEYGVYVTPLGASAATTVAIDHSRIDGNSADGISANSSSGASVVVAVSDSSISLNNNGLNAINGGGATTKVDLTRDLFAGNRTAGIVSRKPAGGTTAVTVGASLLLHNSSATSISGDTVQSFGNNQVTGSPGNGFSGTGLE